MRPLSLVLFLVIVSSQAAVSGQTTRAEVIEKQREDKAAKLETYKPGQAREDPPERGGRQTQAAHRAAQRLLRRATATPTSPPAPASRSAAGSGTTCSTAARASCSRPVSRFATTTWSGATSPCRGWRAGRLEVGVEGIYRHQPQDDYFGPGPDSLERGSRQLPLQRHRVQRPGDRHPRGRGSMFGTRVGRVAPDIAPEPTTRFPRSKQLFDDAAAPGLNEQPAFLYGEGFAEIDYRDEPGHTRAGGHYTAERCASTPTATSISTASARSI